MTGPRSPATGVEEWNRACSPGSVLLYALVQAGWRKGKPVMINDVTIRIEAANGSATPVEPIADRVLAALSQPANPAQVTDAMVEAIKNKWAAMRRLGDPNEHALASAAIAAISAGGQAVAWQRDHPQDGWIEVRPEDRDFYRNQGQAIRPLFTYPAPSGQAVARENVAYFVHDAWGGYWQTVRDGKPYNFRLGPQPAERVKDALKIIDTFSRVYGVLLEGDRASLADAHAVLTAALAQGVRNG